MEPVIAAVNMALLMKDSSLLKIFYVNNPSRFLLPRIKILFNSNEPLSKNEIAAPASGGLAMTPTLNLRHCEEERRSNLDLYSIFAGAPNNRPL
jgi:hypothetical protein